MSDLDLSVIVLSYNTKNITDRCLTRLQSSVVNCQKKIGNKIEVIVVDNASTDGSVEMVGSKHSWVKLLAQKTNTGYSRGNNIGIKKSQYPIILLLNSDVFLEENSLEKALPNFKNPNVDVLGVKLVFGDGRLQPSAGNLPTPLNTIFWILGVSLIPGIRELTSPFHPNYQSFFEGSKAIPVGWVSGAFFMARKKVFDGIGMFDEKIFMYFEEVELCKRVERAGFKIWYAPNIAVTHLHGASSKFDPTVALIRELKGLKYYFKKYYPSSQSVIKLFLILGLTLRVIAFSLLGKTRRARAYIEGLSVI